MMMLTRLRIVLGLVAFALLDLHHVLFASNSACPDSAALA